MTTLNDVLRRVVLSPYSKGAGPRFRLVMWHAGYEPRTVRERVAYEFRIVGEDEPLFRGDDYSPSPSYASDSDKSVAGLLGFLTLKPGDADEEYFKDYTERQLAFAREHAESLAVESVNRFGED